VPVIKISPKSFDYTTGTEIKASSMFTECLSHEMVIIQTRVLKNSQRSLLERFLSNFMPEVQQFLEVNPIDFDRKFISLLKRLEEATMKKEIVELMQRENLIQEEWESMVRSVQESKKGEEEERRQKEEERRQKEEALWQKEEERRQKEELLIVSVRAFYNLGISSEEIAVKLNLTADKVDSVIGSLKP
jgi:hypothetical protein